MDEPGRSTPVKHEMQANPLTVSRDLAVDAADTTTWCVRPPAFAVEKPNPWGTRPGSPLRLQVTGVGPAAPAKIGQHLGDRGAER